MSTPADSVRPEHFLAKIYFNLTVVVFIRTIKLIQLKKHENKSRSDESLNGWGNQLKSDTNTQIFEGKPTFTTITQTRIFIFSIASIVTDFSLLFS